MSVVGITYQNGVLCGPLTTADHEFKLYYDIKWVAHTLDDSVSIYDGARSK